MGIQDPQLFLKGKLRGIIVTVQKIKISSIIYKHSTKTEKKPNACKNKKEKKRKKELRYLSEECLQNSN